MTDFRVDILQNTDKPDNKAHVSLLILLKKKQLFNLKLTIITTIKNIPNNRGIGFCYWAPDWVAFSGNENTSTNGSSWENQCVFDFNLKALPMMDVFNSN